MYVFGMYNMKKYVYYFMSKPESGDYGLSKTLYANLQFFLNYTNIMLFLQQYLYKCYKEYKQFGLL